MEFEIDQRFICQPTRGIESKRELRILAIAHKHIMCRYKGCTPFVKSVKEFPKYLESVKAQEIITKNK